MKNIDLIKQELHEYINELTPRELYVLDSIIADYQCDLGKDIKHKFNCDLCEQSFGSCGLDKDDTDKECCVNRFTMYCNMDAE